MPRAYSEDLRVRVIEAVRAGSSMRAAGRMFAVAASTAITWVGEWRQSGRTAAKPMGGSRSPLEDHATWLLAQIAKDPSLTLERLQHRLRDELGVRAAVSALWRFFHRHGISFKKNRARRRAGARRRRGRTHALERRASLARSAAVGLSR
jgi:transposase